MSVGIAKHLPGYINANTTHLHQSCSYNWSMVRYFW
jgi:hypothetical protein